MAGATILFSIITHVSSGDWLARLAAPTHIGSGVSGEEVPVPAYGEAATFDSVIPHMASSGAEGFFYKECLFVCFLMYIIQPDWDGSWFGIWLRVLV